METNTILLYTLPDLYEGTIIKRPSKHIKSPYVADVLYDDTEYLGHTPSLGCCGHVETTKKVLMYKTEKTKCNYRICIALFKERDKVIPIGIEPKLAEKITESVLKLQLVQNLNIKLYKKEKKILNSRFDFIGRTTEDIPFILEVKNVPLADYEDIYAKERKKKNYDTRVWNSKIAYFPDGYRKKVKDTVSPRALKHVNELKQIKEMYKDKVRCILLFVIQREDVSSFQPSRIDPIYLSAIQNAWKKGVEIKTIQMKWINNKGYFIRNNLPVHLFDDYNHTEML